MEEEVGKNGFGYDPIFFVPHLNKTVAQLTTEEKNAISHRGNALRKLKPLLAELLKRCVRTGRVRRFIALIFLSAVCSDYRSAFVFS